MVIDYFRFNFSFGKFKPDSSRRMVYRLADNFDFSRSLHVKEKERGELLRLV